jgi:hypothetical protein
VRQTLTDKHTATVIAVVFFSGWLVILYAGADHPPPPGFIAVVLIDLVAAFVVYRRVPVYAEWARARRPRRWIRALLEGAVAGSIAAGLAWVLPFGGESSIERSATAGLTWLAVVTTIGAANALLIFGLSAATAGHRRNVSS